MTDPVDIPPAPTAPVLTAGGDGGGQPTAPITASADPAAPAAPKTPEDYDAMVKELRKENASWRTKFREAEPIVQAHNDAQEAAKSEVQRANDRATAAEQALATRDAEVNRLRVATKYSIPEEDHDLLGSGTPEELDARGARLAALRQSSTPPPPPPSDRPVEGLRPGASPTPPAQPDNSYPESWRPAPPRGRT